MCLLLISSASGHVLAVFLLFCQRWHWSSSLGFLPSRQIWLSRLCVLTCHQPGPALATAVGSTQGAGHRVRGYSWGRYPERYGSDGKESACNAGDLGLSPGSGRFPGEGKSNPLQYSGLENSMDRGAWLATFCGFEKSQRQDWAINTCTFIDIHNPTNLLGNHLLSSL